MKENSISREQWGSTMVKWYVTWQYKMNKRDGTTLVSKWYYPSEPMTLPTWDLVNNSSFSVWAFEVDSGKEIDKKISLTAKKANSGSAKLDLSGGFDKYGTVKVGLGWDGSDEKTFTETLDIKWKEDNDDMGTFHVKYADKCIQPIPPRPQLYVVPNYTTGTRFTCTILPCRN